MVVDTNIAVSGLLWRGKPFRLLEFARAGICEVYTSPALLVELDVVLNHPKLIPRLAAMGSTAAGLMSDYRTVAVSVTPAPIPPTVMADPDDDAVLACAVGAAADFIVSGDQHLLALGSFQGIPIIKAAALLNRLTPPSP